MATEHENAATALSEATDLTVAATGYEMRAAARLLAHRLRDALPEARLARLIDSDQGDWLDLVGWTSEQGTHPRWQDIPEQIMDDRLILSPHLYAVGITADPEVGVVPGLWRVDSRRGEYLMDLERAAAIRREPLVEVLVVRDCDAGTTVQVAVAGQVVTDVGELHVDAGSGWDWPDWVEHRDECISGASPAMKPHLREAFDDPPGGRYIDGRRGRDWLDGAP